MALVERSDAAGWVMLATNGQGGRVSAIAADEYTVNLGLMEGGVVGRYYLVYSDGDEIFDLNGVWIGSYKVPLAVLVTRVASSTESFCEVAIPSKGWVIQPGDGVMPISKEAANHLKFATYYSTPNAPRLSGYTGRWRRIAPVSNPYSTIVRYNGWWSLPGLPQGMPPAPPGYYYVDVPRAAFVATDAYRVLRAPQPAPGYWSSPPAAPAPAAYSPAPAPPIQPMYQASYPDYLGPYDFDVNQITDARLIRTFRLTDIEKYALEIQHRGGMEPVLHEALQGSSRRFQPADLRV
jgi:hypothetical protein